LPPFAPAFTLGAWVIFTRAGRAIMKRIGLAAAMLFAAVLAGGAAQAADVGGTYDVYGTNFDGSHYKGTATISGGEASCQIAWKTGDSSSSGICMLSGDVFAAAYALGSDVGLALYSVHDDGTLDGIWTIEGQKGQGTEVLTPAN
jgi:hypothetical protein